MIDQDDADYAVDLDRGRLPTPVAELVVSFGEAIRRGFLAKVSTDVQALTASRRAPCARCSAPSAR